MPNRDDQAGAGPSATGALRLARWHSALAGDRLKFVRDLSVLSGGQLVAKLVGFAAFAFLARMLDPVGYGAVELVVAVTAFFTTVIDCGLGTIGVRRIAEAPHERNALAAEIAAIKLTIALIAIPLMILSVQAFGYAHIPRGLVLLFAASLFFNAIYQDWLLQSAELMAQAAAGQMLRVLAFAAVIALLVRGSEDILAVGWAELAAAAIAALFYLHVQLRRITPIGLSFTARAKSLIGEALPVGLSLGVWTANQYVPLFLMGGLVAGVETGWFAGANRLVLTLATLSYLYHFNLYPTLARAWARDSREFSETLLASFRVVAWLGIGGALAVTIAGAPLLDLVYGDSFASAAIPLAILIWIVPAMLLSGHARWSLIVAGAPSRVLYSQLLGLAVAILAGALFIEIWGATGAALAALASNLSVWACAHVFASRMKIAPPSLLLVLKPLVLALAVGSVMYVLPLNELVSAAGAFLVFALMAPFIDRALIPDVVRLAHVKTIRPLHQSAA
jgi:O-antigen/teichoic acid export membrane protein